MLSETVHLLTVARRARKPITQCRCQALVVGESGFSVRTLRRTLGGSWQDVVGVAVVDDLRAISLRDGSQTIVAAGDLRDGAAAVDLVDRYTAAVAYPSDQETLFGPK